MPIQFDTFNQQKVDNLHAHLVSLAKSGNANPYEIQVDGVKAVLKTEDPDQFYKYEDYLKPDSNQVKIVVYNKTAHRNDQYCFSLKAKDQREALEMGLEGFSTKTYSRTDLQRMADQRQKQSEDLAELEMLRSKNEAQDKELKEKDDLIDRLTKAVEEAKANGNKLGGVHLGEIVTMGLEGFVKRNASAIAKATGLDGFATAFSKTEAPPPAQENSEASFKKKETSIAPVLSEKEKEFLVLFNELEKCFNQGEMLQIIGILQCLNKDKSQLAPVLELLQEPGE